MVAPRKSSKKKKPNKKLFIAIGLAVVLSMLLLILMNSQSGALKNVNQQIAEKDSVITTLKEEMEKLKEQQHNQLRLQQQQMNSNTTGGPQEIAKKNTASVVVAARPVSAGTRLTKSELKVEEWPQEAVPLNAYNYVESLIGRITSADIASSEPVLPEKLIDKETKTLSISDGYRAMTLPITNLTGVGGFITPGARVDLLTVVPKSSEGKESKSPEMMSKILMQNVKVLAVSGSPTSAAGARGKKGSSPDATITVAVPAEEAVKLALAFNNGDGNVQVVLRGFQDASNIDKTNIDTAELITGKIQIEEETIVMPNIDLPPPPSQTSYDAGNNIDLNTILSDVDGLPPPAPPTARTRTHSIEIIQANSRQEVSFETEM